MPKNRKPHKVSGQPEAFPPEVPKRKRGLFVLIATVLLGLLTVASIYRYAVRPATGVAKPMPRGEPSSGADTAVPTAFVGQSVSFLYPAAYIEKSHDVATAQEAVILEQAYFSEAGALSRKIGLTVRAFPTGSLEDVPDYRMRELNPKRYRKTEVAQGDVRGVAFVPADDSPFEKSIFLQKGHRLAILSMSAPTAPSDALNHEADALAGSLTWNP